MSNLAQMTMVLLLCLSLARCGGKKKSFSGPVNIPQNPPSDSLFGDLAKTAEGTSDVDKSAVKNLAESMDYPEEDPAEDDFSEQSLEGKSQVQKILMMSQMLEHCASRAAEKAPVPGQSLVGTWKGALECSTPSTDGRTPPAPPTRVPVNLVVEEVQTRGGTHRSSGLDSARKATSVPTGAKRTFEVTGRVKGPLKVTENGNATGAGKGFQVEFVDKKKVARLKATDGRNCGVKRKVTLIDSADPTPKNYQEGMKILRSCYAKILFLLSPAGEEIFGQMDPQLGHLLKARFLGM